MTDQERRRIGSPLLIVAVIVLVYVTSYLVLTLGGAYAGSVYGLRQGPGGTTIIAPKWYSWAPMGFESGGDWNRTMLVLYLPLYWCDTRWWHTDDLSYRDVYPIRRHPADDP